MAEVQARAVLLPSHRQMQMAFWWQAQSLGAHARVEPYLEAAGYADLLISGDLMAQRPLVVVEFKERLAGSSSVYGGISQVLRYQNWLRKKTGFKPAAYLVAPVLTPGVATDTRWRDGFRKVRVLDALGLSAELESILPKLMQVAA